MKKRTIGVLSAFLFVSLVLTGCSLFSGDPSEDEQKEIVDDATKNFKDAKIIKMEGEDEEGNEMYLAVNGDDYEMDIWAHIVMLGGEKGYVEYENQWYEMSEADISQSQLAPLRGALEEDMEYSDDDWDDNAIEYEGEEEKNGKDCYKFLIHELVEGDEDLGTEDEESDAYIWITKDDHELVRHETISGDSKGEYTDFSYEGVEIKEPSDVKSYEEYQEVMSKAYENMDMDSEDGESDVY